MNKFTLFGFLLSTQLVAAYQVTPNELKNCSQNSDCVTVYEKVCGMPESINKAKMAEWKKIEEANFKEDKKEFPQGHECKPAPGKVTALCSNSLCAWRRATE